MIRHAFNAHLLTAFKKLTFKTILQLSTSKSVEQQHYYDNRIQKIQNHMSYPSFKPTLTACEFKQKYQTLKISDNFQGEIERLAGRIRAIRTHGKTTFIDIIDEHTKVQLALVHDQPILHYNRGDVIGVQGIAFVTKKGQLSLKIDACCVLAPCLWMLPQPESLKDSETKYRNKHLDLITNRQAMEAIKARSLALNSLRRQLLNEGYVQVQTPALSDSWGGALAKPFITYHNDHKMNLYLRVAPELFLKKLVVGGFRKVFEIGYNYRNQSIDSNHNPQFTGCEVYCAYSNYYDMMHFTHRLICQIALDTIGTTQIHTSKINFDLAEEWEVVQFIPTLQHLLGKSFPQEYKSESSFTFLKDLCNQHQVYCQEPITAARMLDKLSSKFLQNTQLPRFIINHPRVMSPLAKPQLNKPHLTERFQVFMNGFELVNSYTELNNPIEQLANTPEEIEFVEALEYGMMPCAGWGIGIDRLLMVLTGKPNIQEVIAFPTMRPKANDI